MNTISQHERRLTRSRLQIWERNRRIRAIEIDHEILLRRILLCWRNHASSEKLVRDGRIDAYGTFVIQRPREEPPQFAWPDTDDGFSD